VGPPPPRLLALLRQLTGESEPSALAGGHHSHCEVIAVGMSAQCLADFGHPARFESFFPAIERCKPETPEQIAFVAKDIGLTYLPEENRTVA